MLRGFSWLAFFAHHRVVRMASVLVRAEQPRAPRGHTDRKSVSRRGLPRRQRQRIVSSRTADIARLSTARTRDPVVMPAPCVRSGSTLCRSCPAAAGVERRTPSARRARIATNFAPWWQGSTQPSKDSSAEQCTCAARSSSLRRSCRRSTPSPHPARGYSAASRMMASGSAISTTDQLSEGAGRPSLVTKGGGHRMGKGTEPELRSRTEAGCTGRGSWSWSMSSLLSKPGYYLR